MIKLYVISGQNGDQFFEFEDDVTFLGRASDNDIQVKDYSISRNHLKIIRKGDKYLIEDLGSRNGTWVDGDLLEPGKELEVREGIPIVVGNTLINLGDKAPENNMLTLYAVSVCSPKGKDPENLIYKDRRFTSRRSLELIYEVSTVLMQSPNIEHVCKKIMDCLFSYLKRIDSGAILWIDSETGELREIVTRSRNNQEGIKISHSRTIVDRVIHEGKAVVISDISCEREENLSRSIEKMLIKSVICVPLIIKSEIRGVFYVHSENVRNGFRRDDLFLLIGLSTPAALAIENGLLHSKREQVEEKLRKAHHELERRVEERTAELLKTNEELRREIRERKQTEEALRKSQERFRELAELLPETIFEIDIAGTVTFVNRKAFEHFGYTQRDLEQGLTAFDMIAPNERQKAKKNVEKVLMGENIGLNEYTALRKDGTTFPAMIHSAVVFREGKPAGLRGFVIDITETKRLENQLQHAQKMEAVGTLAGGIAHDFNNLLQAVQGYAELLLIRNKVEGPGRRELQEIIRAGKRGGELTQQLLTFSRKVESKRRPLDLNQEVGELRELLERTIPKMIEVNVELAEDLKVINGDSVQLKQVLMNLAVNAKDAMEDGGKLLIKTENVTLDQEFCRSYVEVKPGDYVQLSIADTGHGMNEETLEHIFDPFYTTKEVGKGTGLGLAIVYGIVKNHEGYIMCYSRLGEGTTFKIFLPIIEPELEPEDMADLSESEVFAKGDNETILLVDDEEFLRELGVHLLGEAGYRVLTAADGESALQLYRQEQGRIDLVILDLIMPGMGGSKCLENLLQIDPQAQVVIASGYSPDADTKGALESGARGFIRKPYDLGQMLKVVRDVLVQDM